MVLYIVVGVASYLLGSFPTGVFLSRRKYGIDVRETGSGNIGATNVTRTFGWWAGILTLVVDYLKGLVPLLLLQRYYPNELWLLTVSGICLVLGHCFSIYLKLNGGKGVATSFGCVSVVEPIAAVICGAFYVLFLLLTRISAVGSLVGVIVVMIYVGVMNPPLYTNVMIFGISAVVIIRHKSNIKRLWTDIFGKKK